ncbi:glycosyltransferase [Pseudomonas sp. MH9.2]|uniref:glycosyltransferase n=1 Tax=Pseudomonas sp. MH9.2 TaxID=3048629 RepID=UPI002AC8DF09|nr:glycosyltransferase [Pseudomonas sp. MH9.2]MEB0029010.1 glycosyltransferase [Pseudomonas sp. MH9.2]WPX70525.1 glycosyltransferase [Pseudomonas sp. MH9.2]
MQPRFLVLLAAYNGMKWISEQVESILSQQNVSVTLLISVDSSTDGTEQWVAEMATRDTRVIALPFGEKFGGAARNFFRLIKDASSADFDYFSLADQDDIWHPDKFSRAVHVINSQRVDGYSGDVTAFWPDGRTNAIVKSQPQVSYDFLFEAAGPGCTYVFTRDLFIELQNHVVGHFAGVQEVTLHDWYFYAFSRAKGYRWHIDNVPGMQYRQHASNQVGVNRGIKAFRSRLSQVFDGWYLNQAVRIANLVGVSDQPFVRDWINLGRIQLLRLALNSSRCRRRPRDKLVFAGLCLALALVKHKK